MEQSDGQQHVMLSHGHLLVTGGPGSGKTTISIQKAVHLAENELLHGQKILFLSFARATVTRLIQALENDTDISHENKKSIDIETYHSFFWRILKTHGYLIGLPRRLEILLPSDEGGDLSSVRLKFQATKQSDVQKSYMKLAENSEKIRLSLEKGRICFDLFAPFAGNILNGFERIRYLISTIYPVIILDEFQDTNLEQWRAVQALGAFSKLIVLADPEQRIFDFIGADPARLDQFRSTFDITEINLGSENYRSGGTEIAMFGNDILSGKMKDSEYDGISISYYRPFENGAMTKLVTTIYEARSRLIEESPKEWSLAVLVPTKRMVRVVSDTLRNPPAQLKGISYSAIIDIEAAILGSEIIAFLMQPFIGEYHFAEFIELIRKYYNGKGGEKPTKTALEEAERIRRAFDDWTTRIAAGKSPKSNSIIHNIQDVYTKVYSIGFTGTPDADWLAVLRTLEQGACLRLNEIAKEARNVRILNRGTQLRRDLSDNWFDFGAYTNAHSITRKSFTREHFSHTLKPETGVVIMNMHKAKGKQFDEVIIFEGWPKISRGQIVSNTDRIVRSNSIINIDSQTRQNLRVSVTRSKLRTTILTPINDPCLLLPK